MAARRNKRMVTQVEFEDAKDKVMMGAERKSLVMTDEEKMLTAYHEGGHAIVALNVTATDPVHKATIIPRGRALGMVMQLPERDKLSMSFEQMTSRLAIMMGGRVAEEMVFGHDKVTSGAASDIEQATKLARMMVTRWGLSDELGTVAYGENQEEVFLGHSVSRQQNISEQTVQKIDAEIRRLVEEGYGEATTHPHRAARRARNARQGPARVRDAVGRGDQGSARRQAAGARRPVRAGRSRAPRRCRPPARPGRGPSPAAWSRSRRRKRPAWTVGTPAKWRAFCCGDSRPSLIQIKEIRPASGYQVRMSMPAALARRRLYAGPALFSYGFRPFFLGGALWAALGILLWLPQYFGELALPTAFAPLDWHMHEMLYGYVGAVVARFLLTAVPNWTGQLPINGAPLAALASLWLAGRIAVLISAKIGAVAAAVIDVAFLATLAALMLREILAGENWRNLRVIGIVGILIVGNATFHTEAILRGAAVYGTRIGIAAAIALIMLVGGRVVPSFTHNWITRVNPGRLPQPFARFDAISLGIAGTALAAWAVVPTHVLTAVLLLGAGVLQAARLSRWAGDRTLADRLVLVLHVGYAFVPLGFLLVGASILWPAAIPASAGIHAWTAGAVGLMTLAVMTRASLGHTGQKLEAGPATQAIYAGVLVAVLTRIVAAFSPDVVLLHIAALAWVAAFGGFAVVYGPLLVRARRA